MCSIRGVDEVVADALMVTFTVIVGHELRERAAQVPLSERNEAVETFLFDGTNEPLRVRIAVRRPERYPYNPHTRCLEDVPNGGAPLAITVADEKSLSIEHAVDGIRQLPRDLEHERFVRMRCTGDDLDPPRVEFNDEDSVVRDQAAESPST
jgi:hypothetical protein